MADAVVTLYQAEWCPLSSAVREVLTELGVDFVARQAEPVEYFRASGALEDVAGDPAEAEVVDVPDANRYELRLDERVIGLAAYRRRDGRIAFTHTEVHESWEGRGFGSRLAAAALDDTGRQGLDVVPLYPFIARYIERHPEYAGLLAANYHTKGT